MSRPVRRPLVPVEVPGSADDAELQRLAHRLVPAVELLADYAVMLRLTAAPQSTRGWKRQTFTNSGWVEGKEYGRLQCQRCDRPITEHGVLESCMDPELLTDPALQV